ncbi:hypothetical protein SAMN06273572_1011043 [Monaibacterium marinum]|uniref:TIGR03862 family flavoprotein n=1 Tax=Pontivivens marinum TaxID=1690039 RepID=A0A2C9CPP1_9RHOB|nr:TIGR03862 family flavoprotein [Monaibacterium marinum]SOH93188.1 hypothetical protein SAMN06273572_1011043 [Monaibacterium marinum]
MQPDVLIIGGGPAGLAAAEVASAAGASVLVAEQKPSLGRKFLMAGKSGLNLTKDEGIDDIIAACGAAWLAPILRSFDAQAVQDWAQGLGQPVFTGSSGRVFPVSMKGSPLLRAWLARLDSAGVEMKTRWRWVGMQAGAHRFDTPQGEVLVTPRATVLALGGASWAKLGSDGRWLDIMPEVAMAPFRPANMGFDVDWSAHMAKFHGIPVKDVALRCGDAARHGEFVVGKTGVEGSLIYAMSAQMRDQMGADGLTVSLDLAPARDLDGLQRALAKPRGKQSLSNHLRKVSGLSPVKLALLREAGPLGTPDQIAARIKSCPLHLTRTRPMNEAISVAGGIRATGLNDALMLQAHRGVFAAGEMLDWEAPTGGYLLTACLATGRHAGAAAAQWARG